jgi:hypothetical protein
LRELLHSCEHRIADSETRLVRQQRLDIVLAVMAYLIVHLGGPALDNCRPGMDPIADPDTGACAAQQGMGFPIGARPSGQRQDELRVAHKGLESDIDDTLRRIDELLEDHPDPHGWADETWQRWEALAGRLERRCAEDGERP